MWIVVAVVAVLVLGAVIAAVSTLRNRRLQREAEQLREQTRLETAKLERREALAEETAAKARAAQAEADVKAKEAARLQERAAAHQNDVAASREQLEEQRRRADSIDPNVPDRDRAHDAGSDESATNEETVGHDSRLDANTYGRVKN
jgi:uncharacterized protein HemX